MIVAVETPWWGAGLFTLLGVTLSQAFTIITTWRRNKREDHRRWDDNVREATADFVAQVQKLEDEMKAFFAAATEVPAPVIEGLTSALTALSLTAPDEIVVAAHVYMQEIMTQVVTGAKVKAGSPEWMVMLDHRLATHKALLNSTRKYLGQKPLGDLTNVRPPSALPFEGT